MSDILTILQQKNKLNPAQAAATAEHTLHALKYGCRGVQIEVDEQLIQNQMNQWQTMHVL